MKTHLRLIFLAIIAMIVPLAIYAQEDVTSTYLLNPSFEQGDEAAWFHDSTKVVIGWNISKKDLLISYRNQDFDGTQDGNWIFGTWDPSNIGDFQISQTVKNLPAGTYVISCLMTVPNGNNTTQRLFVSTPSSGTKSKIFASSILGNVTIPGEEVSFQGLTVDGVGNGPFKPMDIRIKVAQGDSLVIGIRSNGQKSTILPYSTIGGIGELKVDKFQLGFLSDERAFAISEIEKNMNVIRAVSIDSIPLGYVNLIDSKIADAGTVISGAGDIDSLESYNEGMLDFIATLKSAKNSFVKLTTLIFKAENLMSTTDLTGKNLLQDAYDATYEVFFSYSSLIADFEATYIALDAAIHLYSDGRIAENLALIATVSTSFVSGWEKLSAINDGFEPVNSVDRPHPVYGNWNGDADYGKTNWVQYEWPFRHTIKDISVYWFHDFGGLSQPNATKVEYWESNAWKSAGAIDTLLNKWNTMAVDFKTNKVRLSFSSPTSTGIVEFKVMGMKKTSNDETDYKIMIQEQLDVVTAVNQDSIPKGYLSLTTAIKLRGETLIAGSGTLEALSAYYTEISDFNALLDSAGIIYINLADVLTTAKGWLDTTNYDNKAILQQAYDNALAVFTSSTSLIANFNNAIPTLETAIITYISGKVMVNLALKATASTSYCSSWERLAKINDGFEPTSSTDNSNGKYGNWNGEADFGKTNWVQYDWTVPQIVKNIAVYWFTDGGGLMIPTQASVEYWDGSAWAAGGAIGVEADKYNSLDVDFTSSKVRVSMSSTAATSIIELKVNGYETPIVNLALKASVTTSLCSSWETLLAVNDGFDPTSSTDNSHKQYGNWNGSADYGKTNWVQYDWTSGHAITSVAVYWFSDGGGLKLPSQASIQYWNGSAWIAGGAIDTIADKYNTLNVSFVTSKVRLSMSSSTSTGIIEFKVTGGDIPVGIAPVKRNDNTVNIYPTIIKRGAMINIDFPNELSNPVSVEMFMISGQKAYQTSFSGKSTSFNIPYSLSSGIYLMVINAPEGRMMKKIVIE